MKTIRVFAVEGRSLAFEGGVGRFVARDKGGAPRAEGEEVPATAYYIRALSRGDISTAKPAENESAS